MAVQTEPGNQTSDSVGTAMIKILTFVVIMLTVITGLGFVGLASFNVSRR